jgi:hypothetical protein
MRLVHMTPLSLPQRHRAGLRRCLAVLGLGLGLTACQILPGTGGKSPMQGPDSPRTGFDGPPPARMAVANGAVIIAGPRGFCIDRAASQDSGGRAALTVLSSCRALGAGPFAPRPSQTAVLTAAVAAPGRGGAVDTAAPGLAGFFRSQAGRAALSRTGKAETVEVLETLPGDGALLLHLTDTAPFGWGAVQSDYWRALLMVGGRTVTLSVLAPPDAGLSRDAGLGLMRDFITAARAATVQAGAKPAG